MKGEKKNGERREIKKRGRPEKFGLPCLLPINF
jgi:hypothetical protein